jgi:hypothetical protein
MITVASHTYLCLLCQWQQQWPGLQPPWTQSLAPVLLLLQPSQQDQQAAPSALTLAAVVHAVSVYHSTAAVIACSVEGC